MRKRIPLDRRTYTTGQIASLLEVAPRTVSKWTDSGAMPGYRISGQAGRGGDRRVPREAVIEFCRSRGIPCPLTAPNRLLTVDLGGPVTNVVDGLPAGWQVREAHSAVLAAAALVEWRPSVLLIDTRVGLGAAEQLTHLAGTISDVRRVVALVHEDGPDEVAGAKVVRLPCPPDLLLDALGVGGA